MDKKTDVRVLHWRRGMLACSPHHRPSRRRRWLFVWRRVPLGLPTRLLRWLPRLHNFGLLPGRPHPHRRKRHVTLSLNGMECIIAERTTSHSLLCLRASLVGMQKQKQRSAPFGHYHLVQRHGNINNFTQIDAVVCTASFCNKVSSSTKRRHSDTSGSRPLGSWPCVSCAAVGAEAAGQEAAASRQEAM